MAIAPPFTFTFDVSQPIWRLTAIACAANASLISIRSRSFGSQPARARQRLEAGTGPMPMYFGSTPADAKALMRARGLSPSSFAFREDAITRAAAPSLIPEALPAVTVPALSNAGLSAFIASSVAPWRTYSSSANITGPFFDGISTVTISSLKRPAFCAASALFWLLTANSSCSSRVTAYSLATFSAVMPMWYWLNTSHRPSTIMESTIFASPMRKPSREPLSTCGAALMFSWPPAMTMSESPLAIACAPSIAACSPEPQTLLMVMAGTMSGSPAQIDAWRAGFWPTAAVSTCPMMTSETWSGATPERSSTFLMMCAPSRAAGTPASEPPNLPIADRAAPTMTMSSMEVSCPGGLRCLFLHIAAGRRFDRPVLHVAGLRRRDALAAAVLLQPLRPRRPPAAALFARAGEPLLGVLRIAVGGPETALVPRGRIDHARDMAGRAQHELLVAAEHVHGAVRRAPRHDVVFARGENEGRSRHAAQVHRHAAGLHLARDAQL